ARLKGNKVHIFELREDVWVVAAKALWRGGSVQDCDVELGDTPEETVEILEAIDIALIQEA
ncbi:MAG TPA: hypothetical protein VMG58_00625, partial [Candidatus Sulfotelmatobacter sp.]|nr:hypothetical protein [Candidatus Sulfotelmatobacter sp.]